MHNPFCSMMNPNPLANSAVVWRILFRWISRSRWMTTISRKRWEPWESIETTWNINIFHIFVRFSKRRRRLILTEVVDHACQSWYIMQSVESVVLTLDTLTLCAASLWWTYTCTTHSRFWLLIKIAEPMGPMGFGSSSWFWHGFPCWTDSNMEATMISSCLRFDLQENSTPSRDLRWSQVALESRSLLT